MHRHYTPDEKASYFAMRERGWTRRAACSQLGCNIETGLRWEQTRSRKSGHTRGTDKKDRIHIAEGWEPQDPIELGRDHMIPEAEQALGDFELFRRRYLGHVSTPWQLESAQRTVEWLASPEEEFVVVNVSPGVGKSTLFTLDLPLWLIARNRAIRIFIGSRTARQAEKYTKRIQRYLERTRPVSAAQQDVERGLACDGVSTLPYDYGRFRPQGADRDIWRADEFVVEQIGGDSVEDKESTVTAWGMDSSFLGSRADLIIWDDLVDKSVLRSSEQMENQRDWWRNEAQTRLEPGGVLLLVGQRMAANDLYRFSLDMPGDDDEDDEDATTRKYRHVVYRAHYDELCQGDDTHHRSSPAWPAGCLLDPRRGPWRGSAGLRALRKDDEKTYRVQYQQEDVDPQDVLIQRIWIDGGKGDDGIIYPGCWDDRNRLEAPQGLSPPFLSVLTVDPSPTKFWGVEWWLVHYETRQRFLMDLVRKRLTAPQFLEEDKNMGMFNGLAEDWVVRARTLGYPIGHLIFEDNAAQKFFLQMHHVQRWAASHQITLIGHTTHAENKNSTEYGIHMLQKPYRFGLVRLPRGREVHGDTSRVARSETRIMGQRLIEEVTRYPESDTTDLLMAQWFLEHRLESLLVRRNPNAVKPHRPSWLKAVA